MAGKNEEFSQNDLARLLRKPETKALLDRLRQLDSGALQQAVQMAMQGNAQGAQQLLTPLMQDPQVQELTDRVRDSYGGV